MRLFSRIVSFPNTIPLSLTLQAATAGIVGATSILILAIQLSTNSLATRTLVSSNAHWLMASVENNVTNLFSPVERQIGFLVKGVSKDEVDPKKEEQLTSIMTGALASVPQIRVLSFIGADGSILGVAQGPDGVFPFSDVVRTDDERKEIDQARTHRDARWGTPYFVGADTIKTTVVNLRQSAFQGEEFKGFFSATITIDTLSEQLKALRPMMQGITPFILYGEDRVLAHPNIARAKFELSTEKTLPRSAEIGDPFLQGFLGKREAIHLGDLQAEIVDHDGDRRVIISRDLGHYSPAPLTIGLELPPVLLKPLSWLWWALIASIVSLVLGVTIAVKVSQMLARPIKMMGKQASGDAAPGLNVRPPLSPSIFSELNTHIQAYNNMLAGLKRLEVYVPNLWARRITENASIHKAEPEECIATVMFVDIAGFTAASESLRPSEVAQFLNKYFALVGDCVEKQNGTIDKFIGDGLMAFWGALEKRPDHADRAVNAAELIAVAVEEENQKRRHMGLSEWRIRIGIHSGMIRVGNIGIPNRLAFTIVGDTVNIASRLEQLGKTVDNPGPVTVIVSASTHKLLASHPLVFEPLGFHELSGRKEEVEVYRGFLKTD
ncbi:adenylate/guanylate cyclase domain-containing protein [Agrobacterium sp. SORGH_AS 787]|uniref:adenylate/guanylate cyclase domain-containing protein n=1 Tax=Agrobacterium sp. SORGH_AS 787 TaxID=3041775 RepID=UPI002781D56E|nr:adenylate cyclase [Rhizobium sp. SORGH_AS_0787]